MESVYVFAEQRRAVAQALKIATAKDNDRPSLRAVNVDHGLAFVSDTYVAVNIPALVTLPHGGWSADALETAIKGAGKDGVRIVQVDADTLRVDRFAPGPNGEKAIKDICVEAVPPSLLVGTVFVGRVENVPNLMTIWSEATGTISEPGFRPDVASFSPDLLSTVFAARPDAFQKFGKSAVQVMSRELKPAVVLSNGVPYAIVMPMRGV
jgi:hypothetical protein